MDGMNVKSLEERSEGDVASPSSTGTQVQSSEFFHPFFHLLNSREYRNIRLVSPISGSDIVNIEYAHVYYSLLAQNLHHTTQNVLSNVIETWPVFNVLN